EGRLEREERRAALALEPYRRGPQLTPAGAQPPQQGTLVGREPSPAAEQVAVLRRRDQLRPAPLQRRYRRPKQPPGERGLGPGELPIVLIGAHIRDQGEPQPQLG